ncbi:MAG: hypothetical protein M0R30_14005 [Methanoregula sp.]|jgi:hypothetical protein|uniref:hypothetical protein n=1 Tax=Methanoregula sp. TaxID=2052170 RepID=UPI0025FF8B13|nr:hypothetical protein [Methanoregula sp.]MCK9632741.1 hypothetical protein [Methanoregula sp.]
MQYKTTVLVILLVCAAIAFAGCTGTTPTGPAGTSPADTAKAETYAGSPAAEAGLITSPTDVVPENNAVTVTVQEKVYDGTIPVVFNGGTGQNLVKSIEVTLYTSDGQVKTASLGIKKDDTVDLKGTRQTDRVVVHVSEMNGQTYKVADVLVPYREH